MRNPSSTHYETLRKIPFIVYLIESKLGETSVYQVSVSLLLDWEIKKDQTLLTTLMQMAVMQVGPVRVGMDLRRMVMRVAVTGGCQ